MSTTVDQRVVEMRFDNKHFENNVSATMSTLEKFKHALKLDGATKGLDTVSTSAKRIDLSGLTNAAETVGLKFNAMYTIADQALRNIVNSAMSAGKKIVSALTIDPIKTGLSEYETQINAVQTILANTESKGTTLGQVNGALDELNTYADKTIYNFTEMTRNIGTFTAAGVDLDTSVNAIQGIANLAAVSGSSSQQASTAMYQLSQALASGTVKLMDWNSVVNAGMGGQVFQDALKETARVHGIAIDDMITKNGSFRETLQEGWLTADILTETLSHFTMAAEEGTEQWNQYKKSLMDSGYSEKQATAILKLSNTATNAATKVKTATQLWDTLKETAQSGWTQTWEIILGDFEEAKELFSGIYETLSPILEASAKARNELLEGAMTSNWDKMITKINDAGIETTKFEEKLRATAEAHGIDVDKLIKDHGSLEKAFRSGAVSTDILKEAVAGLEGNLLDLQSIERDLAKGDKGEDVKKVQEALKSLKYDIGSAGVDGSLGKDTEKAIKAFQKAQGLKVTGIVDESTLKALEEASGKVEGLSESVSGLISDIDKLGGRELLIESLKNVFEGVMSVIKPIKEAFREIFPPTTADQLYSVIEAIHNFTKKLTLGETASDNLKRTFKGLFAVLDIVKQALGAVFKAISPLFGKVDDLGGGILGVTAKIGDWLVNLDESIKTSGFFTTAVEKIHAAFEKVANFLKPVVGGIKKFSNEIATSLTAVSTNAEERLAPLAALGNFIKNIFVAVGKAIGKVFPYISAAATGIGNVLSDLMNTITDSIQNADYDSFFDLTSGGIMTAIGIYITKFFKSGSGIFDGAAGFVENLNNILEGAGDALGAFTDSLKADTLKKIATAIAILAASLLVLSLIPSEKLTTALLAVTTMFGELMASMSIFGKMGDMKGITKVAASLVTLSTAIFVLSIGLKIMSTMSWNEMGVGLVSLTVGLGALVGAVNLLPEKKVKGAAKAIKTMSSAILILAVGIKIMSTMSWEEMGVGLISMVVGLAALVGAVNLLPKDTARRAAGMIGLATAMVVLGAALKIMATMSWDDIARSLVALAGSLAILAGAMALMKKAIPGALAMAIIAPALIVLAGALRLMSGMSWESIAKGLIVLGGSLLIIAGAMALMKKAIPGAAALLVVAASLAVLTPVLMALGSMSLAEIGKSLLMLAGVFVVFGLAALVLKPLVGTMIALAASLTLLGVACAAIGAGVLMVGLGITALAAALAAGGGAITIFVASLIGLIPYLIEQIGVGIIRLCEVISGSAAAICEAFTVIILALVDALVASVPAIVDGALVLIEELLKSLATHTPTIVNALFDFIIGLINALADRLPDFIQAGVNLIMSLFQGVIDALKSVDPMLLVNGILAIGMITALMGALAACAALAPAALTGVIGVGAVIAELAIVLAAIGALAQIPGLDWLIGEGGNLMQTIGTAIGQFLGGIVGGFAKGMSAALPQIGSDLSAFMVNATPFIQGAKTIDASVFEGVKSLVDVILALTGANILESLTSWLTGGSSLTKFGEEIAAFAPHIKTYADTVAGIDASAVTASATAAQALAEMTSHIPNEGGVVAWFAGENSISKFGTELVVLGTSLSAYSMAITGFNAEAVIASANAAQALVDMTSNIPNEGGVVAWFTGENSVSKFGNDLVSLGISLSAYSVAITGFNAEAVIASANAAKALVDMTSSIPNEGGMVAWFTGENSVSSWGNQLVTLGMSLAAYSSVIMGFNAEAVIASANAAQALVDMTSKIPNEGGLVAWFTGENSVSKFGNDLIALGIGLKGFSDHVSGINTESVVAAANAGKTLAEMASIIPNEGGVVAWFAGENSISKFSTDLVALGQGLKGFSDKVTGVNVESMTAAANAAKTLASLASNVPNQGGVVAWFTGESSISKFGSDLISLGIGLKNFSDKVSGINATNITAAANAAKALAEMTSHIPSEGGIAAWFTGDSSISKFGDKLPILGRGLKGFADSVAGINPENVTAASRAAKDLADMANTAPENTDNVVTFGDNLSKFGFMLKSYFANVSQISVDAISKSANAIKAVANISSGLNAHAINNAAYAINELAGAMYKLAKVDSSAADGFSLAAKKLAETNVDSMVTAFKNAGPVMENAGIDLLTKFIRGVESQSSKVTEAGKTSGEKFVDGVEASESKAKKASEGIVTGCVTAISSMSSKFESAGKDLGSGLVRGINAKQTAVYNAAYALGQKAVQGEKDGQKSNSPSKLTILAGKWLGEGLIIGMDQMGRKVYNAGSDLGKTASGTISSAITKLSSTIYDDIDTQPTIRPILDLSDVRTGTSALSGMLQMDSTVGIRANVSAISSMMSSRGQNGTNADIVSAIDKLNKKMDNVGNTTNNIINGVTYDDGSNINDAVATLVRAARIERRT